MPAPLWATPVILSALRTIDRYEPTSMKQFGRVRWLGTEYARREGKHGGRYTRTDAALMKKLFREKLVTRDKETKVYELTSRGIRLLEKYGRED